MAIGNCQVFTPRLRFFRLGRIATKQCNSCSAHFRRQTVMVSANSVDRFTPDCGNEFAASAFLNIPSVVRLGAEVENLEAIQRFWGPDRSQ